MMLQSGRQKDGSLFALPYFSSIVRTGGHLKSIEALCAGDVDVGCVDEQVYSRLSVESVDDAHVAALLDKIMSVAVPRNVWEKCELNGDRYSGYIGPNPAQPVVVSTRLPVHIQERIQDSFLRCASANELNNARNDKHENVLTRIGANAYTVVDDAYYSTIKRRMQETAGLDILCVDETSVVNNAENKDCSDLPR